LREQINVAGHELMVEYVDDGHSAARLNPGWDALCDGAEVGCSRFEAAWCLSENRLARPYAYQVLVLDELAGFGVKLHVSDARELAVDDTQAVPLTQVQGIFAEYGKRQDRRTLRRGKLFRPRAREITNWKAPYGYRRIARSTGQPTGASRDLRTRSRCRAPNLHRTRRRNNDPTDLSPTQR
jgi:site-specific DNA recombinase